MDNRIHAKSLNYLNVCPPQNKFQVYSNIQKLSKKKETGPQVAIANLGGPDSQLFKNKINITTVITIKDRTKRI